MTGGEARCSPRCGVAEEVLESRLGYRGVSRHPQLGVLGERGRPMSSSWRSINTPYLASSSWIGEPVADLEVHGSSPWDAAQERDSPLPTVNDFGSVSTISRCSSLTIEIVSAVIAKSSTSKTVRSIGLVERPLRVLQRLARLPSHALRELERGFDAGSVGHDPVGETDMDGDIRGDSVAGEEELLGAQQAGQRRATSMRRRRPRRDRPTRAGRRGMRSHP